MTNEIRVRYAPSPTGHLHIGNARTALFNYLFARSQKGTFIIRVEDTDEKRNVAGGIENQFKYLTWLGIDWDEGIDKGGEYGPYRQTERLHLYEKYAEDLTERGLAYPCYCTEDELEAERQAQRARNEMPRYSGRCRHLTAAERAELEAEGRTASLRFKVPAGRTYTFRDMVKGEVTFESDGIGDFVIVKKDGIPTYNFAVAIDDHLMAISHVLRGDDHISNTPRQLMIYEAFAWRPPTYGHMTLIVNEDRKKLSKRDESILQFIEQYERLGYLPEALFNFIALLGWSPGGEEEIFSSEQFINMFDPARLSKAPAVFDTQKLAWMNNQYIKNSDLDRVVRLTLPHLKAANRLPQDMSYEQKKWAEALISLYQEQLSYGAEIVKLTDLFFRTSITYNEEAKKILNEEQVPAVLTAFRHEIAHIKEFSAENIKAAIKSVQKQTGEKGKRLFMPIRVAITGETHGPELPAAISLLGKQVVESRLQELLN